MFDSRAFFFDSQFASRADFCFAHFDSLAVFGGAQFDSLADFFNTNLAIYFVSRLFAALISRFARVARVLPPLK